MPGLLGAVASTLHPWQGETMILLVLGAELVRWRDLRLWWQTRQWRRLALPVLTLALIGLPLVYYLLLGHLDLSWNLARAASKHAFPWTAIALAVAPLGLFALLGYRGRADTFLELMLRVWAPAAIFIYFFSATGLSATPLHAFDGITIPLAMLAVKGVRQQPVALAPARAPGRRPGGRGRRGAGQRLRGRHRPRRTSPRRPATPTSSPRTSTRRCAIWPGIRRPAGS